MIEPRPSPARAPPEPRPSPALARLRPRPARRLARPDCPPPARRCAFLCGISLILTVVPLHATAAWGASAADLGRLYSFVTLLALVFSPIAGALADRVGPAPLAIGGSVSTALAVACMPLATSRRSYYLVRSAWAAGEAFLITAYSALALDVTPEAQRGARNSLDNQVRGSARGLRTQPLAPAPLPTLALALAFAGE